MSRGVSDKITYKPYNQSEQWLLPPSLEELVPKNHFVRIVSRTVDELDIEELFARNAKGGGASRYNPVMLEENDITGIIKYAGYEKKTKRSFRKETFNAENWKYDSGQKEYTCPCGNPVPYRRTETKKNKSGFLQSYDIYQCDDCEGCPFMKECTKSGYGRMIQRNEHWIEQKSKVKALLFTEKLCIMNYELRIDLVVIRECEFIHFLKMLNFHFLLLFLVSLHYIYSIRVGGFDEEFGENLKTTCFLDCFVLEF